MDENENTYGHGDVTDYLEPRRPRGPSDEEVRKNIRALVWKRAFIGALVLLALLLVGGMGYTVFAIRQQQVSNTPLTKSTNTAAQQANTAAQQAKRSADRIEDCTTPGRDCYERSQKQTAAAAAVGSINTLALIATTCAVQIETSHQVTTEAATYKLISRYVQRLVADKHTVLPSMSSGTAGAGAGKSAPASTATPAPSTSSKGSKGAFSSAGSASSAPRSPASSAPRPTPKPTPRPTPVNPKPTPAPSPPGSAPGPVTPGPVLPPPLIPVGPIACSLLGALCN